MALEDDNLSSPPPKMVRHDGMMRLNPAYAIWKNKQDGVSVRGGEGDVSNSSRIAEDTRINKIIFDSFARVYAEAGVPFDPSNDEIKESMAIAKNNCREENAETVATTIASEMVKNSSRSSTKVENTFQLQSVSSTSPPPNTASSTDNTFEVSGYRYSSQCVYRSVVGFIVFIIFMSIIA